MIVLINQCKTAFHNANRALIRPMGIYTLTQLHKAWIETYDITPLLSKGEFASWESLQFKSEQDYTMFILKWG